MLNTVFRLGAAFTIKDLFRFELVFCIVKNSDLCLRFTAFKVLCLDMESRGGFILSCFQITNQNGVAAIFWASILEVSSSSVGRVICCRDRITTYFRADYVF